MKPGDGTILDGFAVEAVLTAVEHGLVVVDTYGELLMTNAAADELLGPALPWMLGRQLGGALITFTATGGRARVGDLPLAQCLRGETPQRAEVTIRQRRQAARWLELFAAPLAGGGAVLTVRDVAGEHLQRQAASEAQERFRLTFDGAPVGMAVVSLGVDRGHLLQVNAAFSRLAARPMDALLNLRLADLVRGSRSDQDATARLLSGDAQISTEQVRFLRPDESTLWVQLHAATWRDVDRRVTQAIVQAEDIDLRHRYENRLRHLADHDALTGLFNRRRFAEELTAAVQRCLRYGAEGVLILLDLDGFKDVNDTLGHAAGDQVLVATAGALRSRLRGSDIFARLGGDEFAVLLPRADLDEGLGVAQDLVALIGRQAAAGLPGQVAHISATAGVSAFDGEPLQERDVLAEADIALYEAKRGDRGGVAVFAASGRRELVARTTMADLVHQAIREDGFELLGQPVFDYAANAVTRHELLLRLRTPDGELVPPDRFLPVAEQIGAIRTIDRWVFGQAVDLLGRRPDVGGLLVNISAISLADATLAQELADLIRTSACDPRRLTIEITETAAIANVTSAQDLARQLRGLGCQLALDDFGSGFASFHYLKRLPFDVLKIDGEFVLDAVDDVTSRAIIESVVQTARTIGSATIAEYVEDEQTFALLRELGVGAAQGYFIGRPYAIADL